MLNCRRQDEISATEMTDLDENKSTASADRQTRFGWMEMTEQLMKRGACEVSKESEVQMELLVTSQGAMGLCVVWFGDQR